MYYIFILNKNYLYKYPQQIDSCWKSHIAKEPIIYMHIKQLIIIKRSLKIKQIVMSFIGYPSKSKSPRKPYSNFSYNFYEPQDAKIQLDQMSIREKELMQQLECIDISLDLQTKPKQYGDSLDSEKDIKNQLRNDQQLLEQWHKKYTYDQHLEVLFEDQSIQKKPQPQLKQSKNQSKTIKQGFALKPPRPLKKTANCKSTQQFRLKEKRLSFKDDKKVHLKSTTDYVQNDTQISYRQNNQSKRQNLTKQSDKQANQPSMQCTFKPVILQKSIQLAKKMKPSFERLTTQPNNSNFKKCPYQQRLVRKFSQSRINRLSQPRSRPSKRDDLQKLPSFTPTIPKKQIIATHNDGLDIVDRNKIWLEQRQAKIQKIRQEEKKEKQKTQNFTYRPKIKEYGGQTDPRLSKFGMEGMAQHFSRLAVKNKGNTTDRADMTERKASKLEKENNTMCINSSYSYKKQASNVKANMKNTKQKTSYQQALKVLHRKILDLKI